MLTILNEELYSFEALNGTDPRTKKDSFKLVVSTSNKLVRYSRRNENYNNRNTPKPKNGIDISTPGVEVLSREIISILTPSDDPMQFCNLPISLKVSENMKGIPMVSVRCLGEDDKNNSNLFLLAFPFNGMIQPIAEDPKYHIYKGLIGTSVRPFFFNGRRYRKILYLVIEPHMALFNPEHTYHTKKIEIKLESFAIYRDRETQEEKTNHETYTFTVLGADGMYTENWEHETVDHAITIDSNSATPLWTTFKFNNMKSANSSTPIPPKKKGQKDGYVQGSTYITTNKHGIRKEVPMKTERPNHMRNTKEKRGGDRLDEMMRSSGMYDVEDTSDRNNRKKNNKKNNRRNDY